MHCTASTQIHESHHHYAVLKMHAKITRLSLELRNIIMCMHIFKCIDRWHAYGYRKPTNYWSVHQKHIDDIFLSNKSDGLFVLRLRFVNSILNSIITRLCYIATATAVVVGVGHCMLSLTFSPNRSLALAPFDQNDWIIIKTVQSVGLILPLTLNCLQCACIYMFWWSNFAMQNNDQKKTTKQKKSTKRKNNIQWNKSIFNAGNNSIFFSLIRFPIIIIIFVSIFLTWTEQKGETAQE